MALLVPDVGEVELLSRMLNRTSTGDVVLRLYVNDVTPAEGNTVDSFTEADDASYSAKTLTGANWTVSTSAGVTTGQYAQQDFAFAAAATVYGYYVTNSSGTTLLWAERFGSAASLGSSGGTVSIIPRITLD